MSTNESFAIPVRVPRLLDVRQPRTPQRVRVAPAPLGERPLPRFTIEIPLGSNRGSEPAAELTEAGAR
jgi:hypothetical protein